MTGEFAGRRVVVMGLGHFGGGLAVIRWLAGQGARVTVTDHEEPAKLTDSVAQLADLDLTWHLGEHVEADLNDCDLLVVSPAVPKDRAPFVQEAIRRKIPISSEMNLFVQRCRARRVIGITGSAGKSTTTAMTGAILEAWSREGGPTSWMGGNIGRSLLADLERIGPDDVVVLELSSFQLEDLGAIRWSPMDGLITNLQPNHLDRHGTFEAYVDAKLNLLRWQPAGGRVFVRAGDDGLAEAVARVGAVERTTFYAFEPSYRDDLRVPGRHNEENAAGAIALARAVGAPDAVIRGALREFTGLPHRLALAGEHAGVRYYNDSKSTTPTSTALALEAFDCPVVLLIGGRDKGMDFDGLLTVLAERAKGVVFYGETGSALYAKLQARLHGGPGGPNARDGASAVQVALAGRLDEAVAKARAMTAAGDVVVLSPACTSYDQFNNYEERGDTFCRLVRELRE